jgi:phosphonate transport system substrate-binding protein
MTRRCSIVLASLVAMTVVAIAGQPVQAAKKKSLTFAIIQTEEMSVLGARWDKILKYVGKRIGADLNFYATTSYASVVEAMMSGFVDIGKLGPKIYIVARKKSKGQIEPVVATARPPTIFYDKPCACYFGTLVTKKGSGLKTIDSIKGKVLALVDPGSTSGNALPRALFPDLIGGKSLEDYFGRIFYSGSHSASALAIYNGKADAAFISESTLERVINQGKMKKDDLNYLWRSPKIPIDVVTVNKNTLSPEMIKKIGDAFAGMSENDEGRAILKEARYAAFTRAKDSDFDALRKILELKKRLKKKKK